MDGSYMRQLTTEMQEEYIYIFFFFFFILLYHVRSAVRFAVHVKRYITLYQCVKVYTTLIGYLFGKKALRKVVLCGIYAVFTPYLSGIYIKCQPNSTNANRMKHYPNRMRL